MSLNRKAMVMAVGAALAAPCVQAQTAASDKWEIYGKFYPELTHASGTGASSGASSSTLGTAPTGTNAVINRWEMQISNTYIGFRGEKNLGGGLKAIGQLEQSVPLDEGQVQAGSNTLINTFANRDSFAGLAANWGTVRLGNMDTPFKKYGDSVGFLGISSGNFVSPNNVMRRSGSGGSSSASSFNLRRANAVDFASQSFGGLQVGVQYSIGNPTEAAVGAAAPANQGFNPGSNRRPRVVSLGVKWEQGPLYLAAATETHFDLFGGSATAGGAGSNAANLGTNSKDTAVQLTAVYKLGVHSIEGDVIRKQYKETGVTTTGNFEQYKNTAYELVWEARWTSQWRTALSYIKSAAGSCSVANAGCTTNGLDGTQVNAGVAYFLDPSTYLFGLYSRLTNGSAARFNNTSQSVNAGEDTTQVAFGITYNF